VYLLEAMGMGGIYKIGRTTDLDHRLTAYAGLPFEVERVAVHYTPESRELERWLLNRVAGNVVNGEWVRLDAKELRELLDVMKG
jgi:hypothetical protein